MAEYIKRADVITHLRECEGTPPETAYTYPIFKAIECFVEEIPAADVAPVVHARWNDNGRCTNCGCHAPFWCMANTYHESPFCFECGARMEG